MDLTTEKWGEKKKNLKVKTDMLRSICNQSGESVESVLINYYLFIKLSVLAAVLAD